MMIVARIIALLIGYGFGLFQTGYLYGKSKGIDIRQQGSGNAGTTNSLRVLGWKAGKSFQHTPRNLVQVRSVSYMANPWKN